MLICPSDEHSIPLNPFQPLMAFAETRSRLIWQVLPRKRFFTDGHSINDVGCSLVFDVDPDEFSGNRAASNRCNERVFQNAFKEHAPIEVPVV